MIADISLQGHECSALRSLGRFPTSHPMPYIFMEWGEVHERLSFICVCRDRPDICHFFSTNVLLGSIFLHMKFCDKQRELQI